MCFVLSATANAAVRGAPFEAAWRCVWAGAAQATLRVEGRERVGEKLSSFSDGCVDSWEPM